MLDEEKIHYMSKIAIHKKKYNEKDNKLGNFYRSDYIYKKNIFNRFAVLIGLVLVAILVALDIIFVKQTDIFSINYKEFGMKIIVIFLVVMVLYSFIGMLKYGAEYDLAEKRLKQYHSLIRDLEKYKRNKVKEKKMELGLMSDESGDKIEGYTED